MKVSRPNPVVTWDTSVPPRTTSRGLSIDTFEVQVKKRGQCRLSSCEKQAAEEVAPMINLCIEHAVQYARIAALRREQGVRILLRRRRRAP